MRTARERLSAALGNTYRIALRNDTCTLLDVARESVNNIIWAAAYSQICEVRDWSWDTLWFVVGKEYVTPQGKVTRRIASYLYKQHGIKLEDKAIELIGNAAASALSTSGEYDVTFVHREADLWRPGDYGDDGSCYFYGRSAAPIAIFEHGGAGVTVHHANGDAIGRAWIVAPRRKSGMLALWNWYNRRGLSFDMSSLAQLLAQGENSPFRGMEFCPQGWKNENYDPGDIVYINCKGYALCEPGKLTGDSGYIELGIEVESGHECYACGDYVNDDHVMHFEGETYCEDCYPGAECERCGHEVDRDFMYYVESANVQVCDRCHSEHYAPCEECNEVSDLESMHSLETNTVYGTRTDYYCSDCYPGETCHHCAGEFHREEMLIVDDNPVCADCMDEHYTECEDCHEQTANADIVQVEVDGETNDYCPTCTEDHACVDCHNGSADVWVNGDRYVCGKCFRDNLALVDTSAQLYQLSLVVEG